MNERSLSRAREDLDAARVLVEAGHHRQAISRAYFAAFYAAEAALGSMGESRSKHSGVISGFVSRLVRTGEVEEDVGRLLRSLFERRSEADYTMTPVPEEEAGRALADAERVVDAVAAWLEGSRG